MVIRDLYVPYLADSIASAPTTEILGAVCFGEHPQDLTYWVNTAGNAAIDALAHGYF